MSGLFAGTMDHHYDRTFNEDISGWQVSQVRNMAGMFCDLFAFNQPLANWNVTLVTNMREMFYEASAFNQPLDTWNVSLVTDVNGMFVHAYAFNQPLANWNVSAVKDMSRMFLGASSFHQNLCAWGLLLHPNTRVSGMFEFPEAVYGPKMCPARFIVPDLTASPLGPFCTFCS